MANTESAKKRVRQSRQRRARNRAHRAELRTEIKKLRHAVADGDADQAREMLSATLGIVDRSAKKGAIHKNAASRTKARLTRAVASVEG
jgi:small subunit ribosomal protein S20